MRRTILTLCAFFWASHASAYPDVVINNITTSTLEGRIHHGLVVETNGITDPNLTAYEIQIKPDTGGPLPPWAIYSATIQPYDSKLINVPFRNGIMALRNDLTYCVRVRAIYADNLSSWAQRCGWRLPPMMDPESDDDGDTLPAPREYAMGLDPLDPDTDRDGIWDGLELATGRDPLHPYIPHLTMRTPGSLDFGVGNPAATYRNQHQFIEIENNGEEIAAIDSVTVTAADGSPLGDVFHVGSFRRELSPIPPENRVLIPVSFVPRQRGEVSGRISLMMRGSGLFQVIPVRGRGAQMPDCQITPGDLDFGDPAVTDQEVAVRDVTLANRQAVTDTQPPNADQASWSFVVSTTRPELAPGLRGFTLAAGEELRLPVVFPHTRSGNFNDQLEIRSFECGRQRVTISAQAH